MAGLELAFRRLGLVSVCLMAQGLTWLGSNSLSSSFAYDFFPQPVTECPCLSGAVSSQRSLAF